MSLSQANPYWYELSPQSICILCKGVGMGASLTFRNFLLLLLIKKIIKNRKFEFYLIVLWISAAEPHLHIFSNIFGTHRTISFKFYEKNLRRAIKQLFWVLYTKSKSLQRNMLKQSMTSMYFNKTFHATGTICLCDRFVLSRLVFKSLKKQLREWNSAVYFCAAYSL